MGSSTLCANSTATSSSSPLQVFVTIADLRHSNNPKASLTTVALGSCLGVTCYDPSTKIGAMLHAMMPNAQKYPDFTANPARCVDSGVQEMVTRLVGLGANRATLELKVFGGAQVLHAGDFFSIGRQNVEMMQTVAAAEQLNVKVWEVGGAVNRSIRLQLDDGRVHLRMPNRPETAV